jgi:hypothetical protein
MRREYGGAAIAAAGRCRSIMQVVRQQNSIIQSLAELREIEAQRIADERAAVERAAAARVAERAAAEQRVRDEEAARVRAEHEARLALERARLEVEREERLRIDAVAQAELTRQQIVLEQTRMEEELRIRKAALAKTRPTWMVAVTCVATIAAGVLVWFALSSRSMTEEARQKQVQAERAKEQSREDARKAQEELARLGTEIASNERAIQVAMERLKTAQDNADRAKVAADLAREATKRKALEDARKKAAQDAWDAERRGGIHVNEECKGAVFGKGKGCDGK